jgi:hypothetical protein
MIRQAPRVRRRLRQRPPTNRLEHERRGPASEAVQAVPAESAVVRALSEENALLARELGRAQRRFASWLDASADRIEALEAALMEARGALMVQVTRQALLRDQLAALRRRAAVWQTNEELARRVSDLRASHRALETALAQAARPDDAARPHDRDAEPAAGGQAAPRVLCVGGRARQLPALRALVEDRGGRFAHATGDAAGDAAYLAGMLSSCDVVMLHAALVPGDTVRQVDAHCRRAGVPCIRLERLCVRGFRQGLLEALDAPRPAAGAAPS